MVTDETNPLPAISGVYVCAGQNGVGSRIAPADKNSNNLGPRLGLAYALNQKTVLRAAYGISYFQTGAYGGGNNVNQNDAYWPTSTTASPDDLSGAYTFTQGYPARDLVIPPLITPALGVGSGFVNYWHPTAGRSGRMQNWSIGVQRALGASMSIDIAYVGSRGDRLPVRVDINQLNPDYLSLGPLLTRNIRDPQVVAAGFTPPFASFNGSLAQALRPLPQFPNMFPGGRNSDTRGTSTYDALQVKFDKRYSSGLYATVAYTWSDNLTNAPNNFVNNGPMHRNAYDLSMSQHRRRSIARMSPPSGSSTSCRWAAERVPRQQQRAVEDHRGLAVQRHPSLHERTDAWRERHAGEPGVSRRRHSGGHRRQHRDSADGRHRAGRADEARDRRFRSANRSLSQHRGVHPADRCIRQRDADHRRVARVCVAQRRPCDLEDGPAAGTLDAADSRRDVQRVQPRRVRLAGEQHRQPRDVWPDHQSGQHAAKHADCVEGDLLMRTSVLLIGAIASTTIGFAQAPPAARGPARQGAPPAVSAPARGSASVRVPAWRKLRTAVGSLLGWQVGVPLGSFRQDTFVDAIRKAEALDLAVVEGDSTQKVSLQIPKPLDYRLAPGERNAVQERMSALNVRMPVYFTAELSDVEGIARKQVEFAKSLGVETIAVERTPKSLAAIEKLADELGVNVALSGNPKNVLELLQAHGKRIGAYADLGKWQQQGVKPVDGIAVLGDRLLALKVSDRTSLGLVLADLHKRELKPSMITVDSTGGADVAADLSRSLEASKSSCSLWLLSACCGDVAWHSDQAGRSPHAEELENVTAERLAGGGRAEDSRTVSSTTPISATAAQTAVIARCRRRHGDRAVRESHRWRTKVGVSKTSRISNTTRSRNSTPSS